MSELPPGVREAVAPLVGGSPGALRVARVGGGCISPAARVEGKDRSVFVKWSGPGAPADLFGAEAEGLRLLANAGVVRVPSVIAELDGALVLEWLEPGHPTEASWAALGASLEGLHRCTASAFGHTRDNRIGTLAQANGWLDDWPRFFRERRIEPQLARAVSAGLLDAREHGALDAFVAGIDEVLDGAAAEGPSLLHGDLWSGNAHAVAAGGIALVDPACYYGDREVDLAMAELFGGFPRVFFESYEGAWPTPAVGRARRRSAYQVYYLLVHVNLFGAGYVRDAVAAARAALA